MGKRAGIFTILILAIIPVVAIGFTIGGVLGTGQGKMGETYETFLRQGTSSASILLADKGGNAFMVCSSDGENTRLISILPNASPRGEGSRTFLSVYQKEGIEGLKKRVENSLSCSIAGYLEVEFSALAPMVDALGGVEIDGKTYQGWEFEGYLKSLNGSSNSAYAQQNAVLAIGRRFCSAGFWKGQNALRKLLKVTDTDLSLSMLMKIGKKLIPALEGSGLTRYCLPNDGRWDLPAAGALT